MGAAVACRCACDAHARGHLGGGQEGEMVVAPLRTAAVMRGEVQVGGRLRGKACMPDFRSNVPFLTYDVAALNVNCSNLEFDCST